MEDSKIPSHINNLALLCAAQPPDLGSISRQIKLLVELFNDQEIFLLDGLTSKEYTCHLLVHLLDDVDLVNAKYLNKRAPELVTKRSKAYSQVFSAVKELEQYAYDKALAILEKELPASKTGEEDFANKLREVLVWYLQHQIVPKFISKSYSSIKARDLIAMMGNPKDGSLLVKLGMTD